MLEQRQSFEEPLEARPDVRSIGEVEYLSVNPQPCPQGDSSKNKTRCRAVFDSELASKLKEALIATLSPAVINGFEGIHGSEDLQDTGGKPETLQDVGIYLFILWKGPRIFWLYIGQAVNLSARIADHNNIGYRKRHPSLHYHIRNSLEDINPLFVKLASLNGDRCQEAKCLA